MIYCDKHIRTTTRFGEDIYFPADSCPYCKIEELEKSLKEWIDNFASLEAENERLNVVKRLTDDRLAVMTAERDFATVDLQAKLREREEVIKRVIGIIPAQHCSTCNLIAQIVQEVAND